MKRYDLRHLGTDCLGRMREILTQSAEGEVSIFIFELTDFDLIQKSADVALECGAELLNSIRFNEKDWTFVVRKNAKSTDSTTKSNITESSGSKA